MMRYLTLLLCLLLVLPVQAQQQNVPTRNPISVGLYRTLEQVDPSEELHLLVEGDMSEITRFVLQHEALVKYVYRDKGSITLPAGLVSKLAELPGVRQLDIGLSKGVLLNDVMRQHANVDSVHAGYGPLPDSLQGEGVILAFLDTGLELEHPDFWNADSSTRVKYVWDQTVANGPNTPVKYGYGQVWDSTDIDDGNCPHKDDHGHGTRVAGIGSGNGQTVEHYKGVAPKSDIIIVELNLNSNFMTRFADAVDFVLDKASQLDKPVVINASVGVYGGSHDGQDLTARLIDDMLAAKPGRALVCAAGNAGDTRFHLGYPLTSDTTFTWFRYHNGAGYAYVQLWADTANFNKARFGVGINRNTDYAYLDGTPLRNPLSDFSLEIGVDKKTDTLKNSNGQRLAVVDIYGGRVGTSYVFDVVVYQDSTGYLAQLAATGEGRFDLWSDPSLTGSSTLVKQGGLPADSVYPDIVHYRLPDAQQSIVSSWACSPNVITVGNFHNRNNFINWTGGTSNFNNTPGTIAPASSLGPTRTGLTKPDITAPGEITLSPAPISILNTWKNNSLKNLVHEEGWHARMVGTSASSPVVAGVAALYFQLHPEATHWEVIEALHATAKQDSFTGPNLPNNTWGYGKVDAFSMVTAIKGCMDTTALNYDSNAVVSDTCIYKPIGIWIGEELTVAGFRVHPVPAQEFFRVELDIAGNQKAEVQVMNATGQLVSIVPANGNTSITIPRGTLANGLYVVSLWVDGQWKGARKILLN